MIMKMKSQDTDLKTFPILTHNKGLVFRMGGILTIQFFLKFNKHLNRHIYKYIYMYLNRHYIHIYIHVYICVYIHI